MRGGLHPYTKPVLLRCWGLASMKEASSCSEVGIIVTIFPKKQTIVLCEGNKTFRSTIPSLCCCTPASTLTQDQKPTCFDRETLLESAVNVPTDVKKCRLFALMASRPQGLNSLNSFSSVVQCAVLYCSTSTGS